LNTAIVPMMHVFIGGLKSVEELFCPQLKDKEVILPKFPVTLEEF